MIRALYNLRCRQIIHNLIWSGDYHGNVAKFSREHGIKPSVIYGINNLKAPKPEWWKENLGIDEFEGITIEDNPVFEKTVDEKAIVKYINIRKTMLQDIKRFKRQMESRMERFETSYEIGFKEIEIMLFGMEIFRKKDVDELEES